MGKPFAEYVLFDTHAETNKRTIVSAGDKIIVPMGELHAEGAIKDRVVYILALPEPRFPRKVYA